MFLLYFLFLLLFSVFLHQTKTMCRKCSCFYSFLVCRRTGEYISLELFYSVNLTSICSLIPWAVLHLSMLVSLRECMVTTLTTADREKPDPFLLHSLFSSPERRDYKVPCWPQQTEKSLTHSFSTTLVLLVKQSRMERLHGTMAHTDYSRQRKA